MNSYELSVTEASQPLKVTLVWTDPPGAVNAANVLVRRQIVRSLDRCPCFDHRRLQTQRFVTRQVNDLDLTLEDPRGTIVLPMTLNLGGNDATNVGGPMQAVDSLNPVCCRPPPPTHTPRPFILLV